MRSAPTPTVRSRNGGLPAQALDEFNQLIGLLGDVIDGFESVQVLYADPFIETQLADLRYMPETG